MVQQNVKEVARRRGSIGGSVGKRWKKILTGYAFIAPVVLGVLIFSLYPLISSFVFSFFKVFNGIKPPQYFGLFNYIQIFHDEDVGRSLLITFLYSGVTVPATLALSFLLALLLNSKLKGIGAFRVMCYLPVVIPGTVLGILYNDFFDVRFGLANEILRCLGLPEGTFFSSEKTSLITLMFTNLWGLGGGMILWLAALKNVPESLIEAAKIDGAGALVRLTRVTIPMCTSMIFYNLIMGIIGSLQTFGNVYVLTGGRPGPQNSLLFYVMNVYNTAFSGNPQMGYAAALSWILFVIIGLLTLLVFKTSRWVFYGEDT